MTVVCNHIIRTAPITLEEYERELLSWEGIPYRDSGMTRQGVDCLRFVVLMLDWLHGWDTTKLPEPPKRPKQTSLNNKRVAFEVVRWVQARYPHVRVRDDDDYTIRPGDVIVCRNQIHPGHGLIGGTRPNEAWHALNGPEVSGCGHVFKTSLGWCRSQGIVCMFRPTESLLCLE